MSRASLRIMFHSEPPWMPTGFGQQTKQLLPMLVAAGHKVAFICNEGLSDGVLELDGVTYYPRMRERRGAGLILEHAARFQPDVVLYLQEVWPLDLEELQEVAERGIRWIPIVPVDSQPVSPAVLARLQYADEVITYAPFGYRELKAAGIESTLIPHTVDTRVFYQRDQPACRKRLGLPEDIFLFGMVGVNLGNPSRKGYQHALHAFAKFHRRHPKSGLFLHTFFNMENGFPIETYSRELGIRDALYEIDDYDKLYHTDREIMAWIFSCFDCLLLPSTTEGFGVPIIEAMACRTPVIATDYAAMQDLVEDGVTGYKVTLMQRRFSPLHAYVGEPSPDQLYEKMLKVQAADRKMLGANGYAFVKHHFDLRAVWHRHWEPYLAKLADRIHQGRAVT